MNSPLLSTLNLIKFPQHVPSDLFEAASLTN